MCYNICRQGEVAINGFILLGVVFVDWYADIIQSVLDITRCSGPTTSNRVISEVYYIQCVTVSVARGK